VDEQRLPARTAAQASQQGQLGAEDERVVEVDDVEAGDSCQPRDQRRVADRQQRVEPVDRRARGVRWIAGRRRGEDLDPVSAPRLLDRESKRRVARPAGIRREGGREVGDPQRANRSRRGVARPPSARS
jgi:hypothetical protein